MLESLIRMTEAHARLLMKSSATVFDAVSIIILMEHTLMTNLFSEYLPSVLFDSKDQYIAARDYLLYKLGIDMSCLVDYDEPGELRKRCNTPSPIRRIEDSLYINNLQSFDLSMNASGMNDMSAMS